MPDGAVPSRARIVASEGGRVRSSDGVFTLVIPPNALAEDTDVEVTIVPRAAWPADVAATNPIGEVYDVSPDGLEFLVPAYAVHRWDALPDELRTAEGDPILAVHYSQSASGAIETPPAETRVHSDVAGVVARIAHLSKHWVCRYGPGGRELSTRILAEAGTHAVGESWPVQQIRIHSNQDVALAQVGTGAEVRVVREPAYVIPVVHEGWLSNVPISAEVAADWEADHDGTYAFAASPLFDPMTQVGPGNPYVVPAPLPGFTCVEREDPGTARIAVVVHAFTPGLDLGIVEELGYPTCTEPASSAAPLHDHIIAGSACRIVAGSLACDPATSGSAVSIQSLSDEDRAAAEEIAPGSFLVAGAPPDSERGPAEIDIVTAAAELDARYDETLRRYVHDLPPSTELFAPEDTMHLEALAPGATTPTTIEVPAPPPIESVEDILSEIDGVSSVITPRSSDEDWYVIASLAGGGTLYRQLTEPGPLLDDATQAALAARSETVVELFFGPVDEVEDTTLFESPVRVAAGRFVIADPADLVAPVEPGGAIVRDCASLPFDFTAITDRPGELGVLCIGADGSCFVTNDVRTELPLLATECPTGSRALVFLDGTGGPTADVNGDDWRIAWTDYGSIDVTSRSSSPPAATDVSTVVHRLGDDGRWRVDYRVDAGTLHVEAAAPYSDPLPPYGESYDARDTPRTFTSSYEVGVGGIYVYARVCVESTGIFLFGNTDATPESELCHSPFRFALALMVNSTGPVLDASHPGSSDWTVVSTTHGTSSGGGVDGIPTGVDVTTRIASNPSGFSFDIVYRYTGSGFIVQSVTEL